VLNEQQESDKDSCVWSNGLSN